MGTFTNPFRYFPSPSVVRASKEVIARIDSSPELREAFSEGKMIGILEIEGGYLAAFSGSVGGRSHIEGFVPPIFDLLDPKGHFKLREAEISALNNEIQALCSSSTFYDLQHELAEAERRRDEEINRMKARMAITKQGRDEIRSELSDPSRLESLIRESQFEKAELKRLKISWEEKISVLSAKINEHNDKIRSLKTRRSEMSDELQDWIFSRYIVHNSLGEESSIKEIFAREGLVPPGGTGDCAAPKLLDYAFRNGLKPIAMGEFWYGKSPETAVRTHGHFYPSCTSKCGPLLGWMLRGLEIGGGEKIEDGPEIIYEDEALVAVDKPSGVPSVPGLDGRVSAYEILKRTHPELYTVHRLDMDTSGILLFAKTPAAAAELQRQFEEHSVRKTYFARLSACGDGVLCVGDKGRVELPLGPDYDERPRQKIDYGHGKPAVTEYEVTEVGGDGTVEIIFHPYTGRTHQLRVHSAHILCLGRPIIGDLLYGGSPAPHLCLRAQEISFIHPVSKHSLTLKIK